MDDTKQPAEQIAEASAAMTIPEFCPRDGSIMVEGVKFGYPAWVCPSCTYWKLKT